jgi:hypothetical protein
MLTAIVLVCSIAVTPDLRDCDQTNARIVMHTPEEYGSAAACAKSGQTYLAGTAMGQALVPTDRIKVVCARVKATENAAETAATAP